MEFPRESPTPVDVWASEEHFPELPTRELHDQKEGCENGSVSKSRRRQDADEIAQWLVSFESHVDKQGWGTDPCLWLVAEIPMGTDSTGGEVGVATFAPFPFPDDCVKGGIFTARVSVILNAFVEALDEEPKLRPAMLSAIEGNGDLFAVGLAQESYSIPRKDVPAWRGRNWAKHPQRREGRRILVVDRNKVRYTVDRVRETFEVTFQHSGEPGFHAASADGELHLLGKIFDRLVIPTWLRPR